MEAIKSFKGKYYFLSNFYPCEIEYEGQLYASVECAYQAAKSLDPNIRYYFTIMDNSMEAKSWGNKIAVRDDWATAKHQILRELLTCKFQNPRLRQKLLRTGDAYIEGGTLGRILMDIRAQLFAPAVARKDTI